MDKEHGEEPRKLPAEAAEPHRDAAGAEKPSAAETAASERGARRRFPHAGDLLALLGIFFLAQCIGLFVGRLFIPQADGAGAGDPGRMTALSSLVCYVLSLWGMLFYRRMRGARGPFARFSLRGLDPSLLLRGLLLLLAAGVVLEPLLSLLPPSPMGSLGNGGWILVSVVLFAPFFEELICRGVVLESLRARYGVAAAWLGSSLFFGVMHIDPQLSVNAFFMGLIFAYIYMRAGSIWPVMILHAVNNAIAYLALVLGADSVMLSELIPDPKLYWAVYAVAAVICVVSAVGIARTVGRPASVTERHAAGGDGRPDGQ